MKIEIRSSTIWALLLALLILFFVMPQQRPAAKPAQRPTKPLFHRERPPMRTQEELDQEVYAAARKPIERYYERHPEETPVWKDVENHANQ